MAIQATELRIGNYLEYHLGEEGSEWEATKIDEQDIVSAVEKEEWFNEYHRPIPLTPEILEKCGGREFEPRNYDFGIYWYDLPNKVLGSWFIEDGTPIAKNILYLHQLQNLYHALTGEELTIDL